MNFSYAQMNSSYAKLLTHLFVSNVREYGNDRISWYISRILFVLIKFDSYGLDSIWISGILFDLFPHFSNRVNAVNTVFCDFLEPPVPWQNP